MFTPNTIVVIADDLTGANDTALQFFVHGAVTEILLDYNKIPIKNLQIDVWAVSTESRNKAPQIAYQKTKDAYTLFKNKLNVDYFYKKLDSTLRGNVGQEILAALEITENDCAIVAPAFIQEGRVTIGGYQLLKGIPIERTEAARDPHVPVFESSVPNILKKQIPNGEELVGLIDFSTVSKGAAPLVLKIDELIKQGKKMIVVDAISVVDMEQIVLAIKKTKYNILPCGSAGLAQAFAKDWLEEVKPQNIKKTVPPLPKLILSGSATELSALQLKKVQEDEDIENTYFINLKVEDILNGVTPAIVNRIVSNLEKTNIVAVHVSDINKELEDENSSASGLLIDEGITKDDLASRITKYLALLAQKVKQEKEFALITIGGETSYKCCEALYCDNLQVIDVVLPAIPLCMSSNAQLVITKSGNLGTPTTLIEILKYFERHE